MKSHVYFQSTVKGLGGHVGFWITLKNNNFLTSYSVVLEK